MVFLNHGPSVNARLVAMDKRTGKSVVGKQPAHSPDSKPGKSGFYGLLERSPAPRH